MRITLLSIFLTTLAGCSWERMAHYSPYDLNYDGELDVMCPGTVYDTDEFYHYSWRSRASAKCNEEVFGDKTAS